MIRMHKKFLNYLIHHSKIRKFLKSLKKIVQWIGNFCNHELNDRSNDFLRGTYSTTLLPIFACTDIVHVCTLMHTAIQFRPPQPIATGRRDGRTGPKNIRTRNPDQGLRICFRTKRTIQRWFMIFKKNFNENFILSENFYVKHLTQTQLNFVALDYDDAGGGLISRFFSRIRESPTPDSHHCGQSFLNFWIFDFAIFQNFEVESTLASDWLAYSSTL